MFLPTMDIVLLMASGAADVQGKSENWQRLSSRRSGGAQEGAAAWDDASHAEGSGASRLRVRCLRRKAWFGKQEWILAGEYGNWTGWARVWNK